MRTTWADAAVKAEKSAVILCTISVPDGRTIRAATRPVSVSADLGGPWLYDHHVTGIESFAEEIDVFALDATASMTQAQVEVVTTDDLAALAAAWHHIIASTVEIATIWPGERWESRRVLLRGAVQALELGREGEASAFAIEAVPAVTSAQIGDDSRLIADDYGTGLLDTGGDDMNDPDGAYPIILGSPLRVPAVKVGAIGGVNVVVLCGHRLPDTTALVHRNDDTALTAIVPVNGTVTSGKVATLSSAVRFLSPAGGSSYGGAVTIDYTTGGIGRWDAENEPTMNAADVIQLCLARSGLDVDWARMLRAVEFLRSWRVGSAITQQSTYIDVARDVAKLLPVIEVPGADGLWFAYANPEDMPITGTLRLGQELVGGSGRVTMSDRDVVRNRFTMRYLRNSFTGEYEGVVTLGPDTSTLCYLSDQLFGELADDVIDGDWIWDESTALRCLTAKAGRVAMPRRSRDYVLSPDAYHVEVGTVYRVVDADYSIDARGYIRAKSATAPYVISVDFVDRSVVSAL